MGQLRSNFVPQRLCSQVYCKSRRFSVFLRVIAVATFFACRAKCVKKSYGASLIPGLQSSIMKCPSAKMSFPMNRTLRNVLDIYSESDVQIVTRLTHKDHGKVFKVGTLGTKYFEQYCQRLHPNVWFECAKHDIPSLSVIKDTNYRAFNRRKYRFTTEHSYIAEVNCAFVELWGSVHKDVPGAVFDHSRTYVPQIFARGATTKYEPNILTFDELAVAIYPYTSAKGHFVHETLPRILWLLSVLPERVMILAPRDAWAEKYLSLVAENGVNIARVLPFVNTPNTVAYAERLYTTSEWPYIHQEGNPNAGGEPTEYPFELMSMLHKSLVPIDSSNVTRRTILLIDRGSQPRYLIEHSLLLDALNEEFNPMGYAIRSFGPNELSLSLREHSKLFNSAVVILGPHGAGFANMVFCAEQTAVIELGFDGTEGMSLDDMYYQLALGLHLRYWLILGKGSYLTNISVDVNLVVEAVKNALDGEDPNEAKNDMF